MATAESFPPMALISVLHLIELSFILLGESPLWDYAVTVFRTIMLPFSESLSFHDNHSECGSSS